MSTCFRTDKREATAHVDTISFIWIFNTFIPLLSLIFLSFLRAEIVLSYKFRTKDAKNYFDNQKGTECVHKALVVEQCGKDHLLAKEPAGQVEYTACIKKIGLPAEFETEVLALQPFDFKTPATFEYTYNQKLINYVKKIDNMYQGSARLTTLQFSFNWLALLAVPLAFGIVFFLNKKPEATASDEVVESV